MKRLDLLLCLGISALAVTPLPAQVIQIPTPSGGARKQTPAPAAKEEFAASLSKEPNAGAAATTFSSKDAAIYLQWKGLATKKGEEIRAVWIAENAAGLSKNKKLTENTQTTSNTTSRGTFNLNRPGEGFPAGKYRAELYHAGKLVQTARFTVK